MARNPRFDREYRCNRPGSSSCLSAKIGHLIRICGGEAQATELVGTPPYRHSRLASMRVPTARSSTAKTRLSLATGRLWAR